MEGFDCEDAALHLSPCARLVCWGLMSNYFPVSTSRPRANIADILQRNCQRVLILNKFGRDHSRGILSVKQARSPVIRN